MKPAYKTRKFLYSVTLLFLTISGFAQMPIFKRYYIADIPGFGWLAQYYVTHIMHYIAAGVISALAVYIVLDFIFNSANYNKLIFTDYFKIFTIAGLFISGGFLVYKNLSGIYFNHNLIIALDILHISLCMMLLGVSFYTLIRGKKKKRSY